VQRGKVFFSGTVDEVLTLSLHPMWRIRRSCGRIVCSKNVEKARRNNKMTLAFYYFFKYPAPVIHWV
jgi:hypothetical protein